MTPPDNGLVEKVAEALWKAAHEYEPGVTNASREDWEKLTDWDAQPSPIQNAYRKLARAAIEAMGSHSQATGEIGKVIAWANRSVDSVKERMWAVEDALKFYADEGNYNDIGECVRRARVALAARSTDEGKADASAKQDAQRIDQAISKTSSQHMTAGGRKG